MRLSICPNSIRIGDVEIHETFRVTELDAGHRIHPKIKNAFSGDAGKSLGSYSNVAFSHESLHDIETQLAIIVPCMNEEQNILEGVLHGLPHDCLIILVSNSNPSNFKAECKLMTEFCGDAQRPGIIVHQKDEGIAWAFHAAGMPEVVVEMQQPQEERVTLRIRNGKGEAMMIGTAIAKLAGKQFVGFIDADNLVTGSVHEYCKVYAAGLYYAMHCTEHDKAKSSSDIAQSTTESNAMVRIKWNSKPKVKDGKLVFEESGRCSRVVNEWMNRLMNALAGDNTENRLIQTSNAGEHAMSLSIATKLHFATGYAVEPFQLINAWEQFGARTSIDDQSLNTPCARQIYDVKPTRRNSGTTEEEGGIVDVTQEDNITGSASTPAALHSADITSVIQTSAEQFWPKLRIIQCQTRSPHFHDVGKGYEHIQRMQVEGLSTLYHSRLTPQKLKDDLGTFMKEEFPTAVGPNGEPARLHVYPPMQTMDFKVFRTVVKCHATTLKVVGDMTKEELL